MSQNIYIALFIFVFICYLLSWLESASVISIYYCYVILSYVKKLLLLVHLKEIDNIRNN